MLETNCRQQHSANPSHGQLTLEIVYCMGSFALAPVAVLDGDVMGRLRQEMLLRRLRKQIAGGE